jgi:MBG domain (YGX type)
MKFPSRWAKRAAALVSATAIGASLIVAVPALVSATPPSDQFSCAGGSFFRVADGDLTRASDPDGPWSLVEATGKGLNALAYRASDRYFYAAKGSGDSIYRVTTGSVVNLGAVAGLPSAGFVSGAIDQATGTYYIGTGGLGLYAVNIEALTATSVTLPGAFKGVGNDIVIDNGWVWTVKSGFVSGFNLTSNEVKNYAVDSNVLASNAVGGAIWLDADGSTLYVETTNAGELVKITGVGGASISATAEVTSISGANPIDGSECRKVKLTVTPDGKSRTYGDAAPTYTFSVTGFINGEDASSASGYVAPTCSSSYTSTTSVSASPLTITCTGGSADDYEFDTTPTANLTVSYAADSLDCALYQHYRIGDGALRGATAPLNSWTDINTTFGKMKNAVAVRPEDRRLYGFSTATSNVLYRGGIFGSSALGAVSGLPAARYFASDFDASSGLMYVYSNTIKSLYAIDVVALTATKVNLAPGQTLGYDFAIVDGNLWTYTAGKVTRVRLIDQNVTSWTTAGGISRSTLRTNAKVGAIWYDKAQDAIFGEITNDGTIVRFGGITSGNVVSSVGGSVAGSMDPIDGAFCHDVVPVA